MINGTLRAGYEVDDLLRIVLDEGFKTVKPLKNKKLYIELSQVVKKMAV